MKHSVILSITSAFILATAIISCEKKHLSPFEADLRRLDDVLSMADEYVHAKEQKISTIENMLHSRGVTDLQKYNIYGELFDEYEAYQFDKAKEMLEHQEVIARKLDDKNLENEALLDRAMLFINAGLYLECSAVFDKLDTLSFDERQKIQWYNIRQKFLTDYDEYVRTVSIDIPKKGSIDYYQNLILKNTPDTSPDKFHIHILRLINQGDYDRALIENGAYLENMDKNTREYSIRAYWQGAIYDRQGIDSGAVHWWVESSISDIKAAIKDNASLSSLAQKLSSPNDTDRAFRYIRFSLDDAIFYNAKLRKVQIASVFPMIEKAYTDSKNKIDHERRLMVNMLLVVAVVLLLACFIAIRFYLKARKKSDEVDEKNHQLAESNRSLERAESGLKNINLELVEANAAKEEYLGLFLSMCSGYLDKLKKAQGREQYESELRNFYKTFDTSFIQLYPTFVEDFNALLKEDSRITLRDGETLNTELRIFALIKLGITQSSHIASLLRYSVNTIYNYRAQVKNAALSDRENFEEIVRKIGSKRV